LPGDLVEPHAPFELDLRVVGPGRDDPGQIHRLRRRAEEALVHLREQQRLV